MTGHPGACRFFLMLALGGLFAGALPVGAELNTWTSHGPEGAAVYALAVDPVSPGVVYAGTRGGVFKSTDAGMSWRAVNTGLVNPIVLALAIDRRNPTTVYAGLNDMGLNTFGVFKTLTGGGSWQAANVGLPAGLTVTALALDPSNSSTLYAGAVNGRGGLTADVYKSTNGGMTWSRTNAFGMSVSALAVDPMTPSTLYAAGRTPGSLPGPTTLAVIKSVDSGLNWFSVPPLSGPRPGVALAIDPTASTTIYAGIEGDGVFKSMDGGASWTLANSGLGSLLVRALVVDPVTPSTIYAGTLGGVFKSLDAGANWTPANTGLTTGLIFALTIDPQNPTALYAGAGAPAVGGPRHPGVYKTTSAAASWMGVNSGLTNMSGQVLAVDGAGTIYVGTSGDGVFKSVDRGATWSAANSGLPDMFVSALAVDPTDPRILFSTVPLHVESLRGTVPGVFKSTDGGVTWTASLPNIVLFALAIDPTTPRIVYAGNFKSTDQGLTWSRLNLNLGGSPGITALAIDPRTPSTIYAVTREFFTRFNTTTNNLRKSNDGGATWSFLNLGLPQNREITAIVIDPVTPGTLYVGTHEGVFKSTDGGETWAPVNVGLTNVLVQALAIDPSKPSTIYAGTVLGAPRGGAFKSTDAGATWTPINAGLTVRTVSSLAVDPTDPRRLYAATDGGGVFVLQQATPLVAAVLPSSRSARVGVPVTVFATIINAGAAAATGVRPTLNTPLPASLSFQTTDPATNAVTGTPNTPVDLAPGAGQSFVVALTPAAVFGPTDVTFAFEGIDAGVAGHTIGVNTLLLSASSTPVPDIVALAATLANDGIVDIPGPEGTGVFAVATVNVGGAGTITASADTGTATLPVTITLCETNPPTGVCTSALGRSVTTTIAATATPTFGVFVQATGSVPFDPAINRVFVRFTDAGGATRGSTSVAARTQ